MNNMVCKRNMVNEFMSGKSFVMYICLFFTKGVKKSTLMYSSIIFLEKQYNFFQNNVKKSRKSRIESMFEEGEGNTEQLG